MKLTLLSRAAFCATTFLSLITFASDGETESEALDETAADSPLEGSLTDEETSGDEAAEGGDETTGDSGQQKEAATVQAGAGLEEVKDEYAWGVGAQLSPLYFLGSDLDPQFGLRALGIYNLTKKVAATAGFSFYVPNRATVMAIDLQGRYLIVGDNEQPFGWHLGAGASLVFGSAEATDPNSGEVSSEGFGGFSILLGTGVKYRIQSVEIMADAFLGLPATEVNGQEVDVQFPPYLVAHIGAAYRF